MKFARPLDERAGRLSCVGLVNSEPRDADKGMRRSRHRTADPA